MQTLPALVVADCGHSYQPPGPEGGASGYATSCETGKTMCYECAHKASLEDLRTAEGWTGYLSQDGQDILGWTGKLEMHVYFSKSSASYRTVSCTDVHGRLWKGRYNLKTQGPGMYINLKPASIRLLSTSLLPSCSSY